MLRGLEIGLSPIFIDECGFLLKNNNFRNWISSDKEYHAKLSRKESKINLIMAVSDSKVFCYKLNNTSTSSKEFKIFLEDLIKKMSEDEKEKHILILDNLKSHLTIELFQVYFNNKMKILFNVPYKSCFNMIEKVFRHIKNITYKAIYSTKKELLKDLNRIINSEQLKQILKKLYRETLYIYKDFIKDNLNKNLNI